MQCLTAVPLYTMRLLVFTAVTSPPVYLADDSLQIANQGEHMFDVAPSPGFLKSIFPCLRKGTPQAGGSMAWVKLVDSEGRVAGHAVLSSRISMALLGGEVRRPAVLLVGWLSLLPAMVEPCGHQQNCLLERVPNV